MTTTGTAADMTTTDTGAARTNDEATELLAQLVSIDSVNPGLVPGAAGEEEIASFIVSWLAERGVQARLLEPVVGRPSVVAELHGTGPTLMFNGHIDTVGIEGMVDPHLPTISDGTLYGRGAYDMKAGVAASLLALVDLKQSGFPGSVVVTAVADEEDASIGSSAVIAEMRPDAVVVTEPTELQPSIAHKGFVWARMTTHGRAAHGSRRDLGVDSIAQMGEVLQRLAQLDSRLEREGNHPLLGSGSVHASRIRGGREFSTYPESCTLELERRTLPGEVLDDVVAELRNLVSGLEPAPSFEVTLTRPAFGIPERHELVQLLVAADRATGGNEPIRGEHPWTDAALFADVGTPVVIYGPGGFGAHADVEGVELADVQRCRETLVDLAWRFHENGDAMRATNGGDR